MAYRKTHRRAWAAMTTRLLVLLTALVLVAAACSSESDDSTTTSPPGTIGTETTTTQGSDTTAAPSNGNEGMSSADIAVQEAQQYRGTTIDVMWAGSIHATQELEVTIPLWEELTGITVNLIDTATGDMLNNAVTDHFAGGGSYDLIHSPPLNLPDLVENGVVEDLDPYIEKYMNPDDLADFHPLYTGIGKYKDKQYALFDDGDIVIMYYRTDVFADPDLQAKYQAEFGQPLVVPTTYDELAQVAQFITDEKAPEMYGFMADRGKATRLFRPEFLVNGGEFFDVDNDMRALINSPAGVETANQMLAQNAAAEPGIESGDAGNALTLFLTGRAAMTFFWGPLGRWAHGIGQGEEGFDFVPQSVVSDVTGYSLLPGNLSPHVGGFEISLSADSDAKDAAYLYAQWVTSPSISLQRVTQPNTMRDPYRESQFDSPEYQGLFVGADEYLNALKEAASYGITETAIPGSAEYVSALDQALADIFQGADPQAALDTAADEWNRITDRIGVDAARDSWNLYLQQVGSSPDTTAHALGLD